MPPRPRAAIACASRENKVSNLVTLTTDFGSRDPYVASVKGVILSRCPDAKIVDLTHEIDAGDVREGALFLAAALPHFPEGAIHFAVIDPGVGAGRNAIAARFANFIIVCPDNGLLTLVARNVPIVEARIITNPALMLKTISATFHGRDIFAPVAAALATGTPFTELGPPLTALVTLDLPVPKQVTPNTIEGEIIHVDRFGNLITNIRRATLGERKPKEIRVGDLSWNELARTYADVEQGASLVLFGSAGYMEISVYLGSAAASLSLGRGDAVHVLL